MMTVLGWIFLCLFLVSALFNIIQLVLLNRSMQRADAVDVIAEQVEKSLDIMDECYGNLTKLLETPVLTDDPIARAIVAETTNARDAILLIANLLVSFDQENEEQADAN